MSKPLRVLALNCVSCGSNLKITGDMEKFACGYCGTQQIVERRGGTVALKPLTDAISKVQAGTDKTAAELALRRLREELGILQHRRLQRMNIAISERQATVSRAVVGGAIAAGVCGFVGSLVNGAGTIIGILIGCGLAFYYWHHKVTKISALEKTEVKNMDAQIGIVKGRISSSKKIVDS